LTLPSVAACGGTSSAQDGSATSAQTDKTASFSYWLGTGDPTYYNEYSDNPVVKYLTSYKKWGKDSDTSLKLSFVTPAAGSQLDNMSAMIGSGDYTDIMDMTYYKSLGSVKDFYTEGGLMDLTDYVKTYMPNYLKWLDNHPSYKNVATSQVEGETKYLEVYDANDEVMPWCGFCYRRDWIAKYGTNPKTGAAFTGAYDANNVWSDDIVFPSGKTDPTYLSDWVWMLPIFKTALTDQKITDGYAMGLNYPGYYETGDLANSFGISPTWYMDSDNKTIKFGADTEGFRTYLSMMSSWYKAGYIDKSFTDHTNEMFWKTDLTKVWQGKVGMWYGMTSECDNRMGSDSDADGTYTKGICVYAAPQPINDTFGSDAVKNKTPFCFFANGQMSTSIGITSKAKDKDIPAFLTFLDYLYSDTGCLDRSFGLSKAEYEECHDDLYTKNGLTDGAYTVVDSNGSAWVEGTSTGTKMYKLADPIQASDTLNIATIAGRLPGRSLSYKLKYQSLSAVYQHCVDVFGSQPTNYSVFLSLPSSLSGENSNAYNTSVTKMREFLQKYVPQIVKGTINIDDDAKWNSFVSAVNKLHPETTTAILQSAIGA
jgi:putative aldouronate transport system substrate-binding protein